MTSDLSSPPTAAPRVNAMTSGLQAREIQSIQMAMLAAKTHPRDEKRALDRILNSCSRASLAMVAIYQYSRGGTDIQGPSIRLAEAIAQQWGNIESGWRELERTTDENKVGISTVEAYAWDLETNFRVPRTFTVRHWRDKKNGKGYALQDERDIYELCANQASRRVRACLLAVIPGDIVEEAQRQCDVTLQANADTSPDAQRKILDSFAKFGVTKDQLEKRIQRRIDAITPAQVISLRKVLASMKDGMSTPEDWFESAQGEKGQDPAGGTGTAPTGQGFQTVDEPEEKAATAPDVKPQEADTFQQPAAPKPKQSQGRRPDGVAGAGANRLTEDGSVIAYYDDVEVRKSKPDAPNPWVQYKIRVSVAAKIETYYVNDDAQLGEWIAGLEEGTRLRIWLTGTIIARAELAPEGGDA